MATGVSSSWIPRDQKGSGETPDHDEAIVNSTALLKPKPKPVVSAQYMNHCPQMGWPHSEGFAGIGRVLRVLPPHEPIPPVVDHG